MSKTTTFITLEVTHDPEQNPATWNWQSVADHRETVTVRGSHRLPDGSAVLSEPQPVTEGLLDAQGAVSVAVEVNQDALLSPEGEREGYNAYDAAYNQAFDGDGLYTEGTTLDIIGTGTNGALIVHLECTPEHYDAQTSN